MPVSVTDTPRKEKWKTRRRKKGKEMKDSRRKKGRNKRKNWRRKWQPTPVFLPGQRSLTGYSPWSLKEWDTTERLHLNSNRDFPLVFSFPLGTSELPPWSKATQKNPSINIL